MDRGIVCSLLHAVDMQVMPHDSRCRYLSLADYFFVGFAGGFDGFDSFDKVSTRFDRIALRALRTVSRATPP